MKKVKLVMISVDTESLKEGMIIQARNSNKLAIVKDSEIEAQKLELCNYKIVEPILISEEDEIKEGDSFLNTLTIYKCSRTHHKTIIVYCNGKENYFSPLDCKKIIATNEQIGIIKKSVMYRDRKGNKKKLRPVEADIKIEDYQEILDNNIDCYVEIDDVLIIKKESDYFNYDDGTASNNNFNKPKLIDNKVIIHLNK